MLLSRTRPYCEILRRCILEGMSGSDPCHVAVLLLWNSTPSQVEFLSVLIITPCSKMQSEFASYMSWPESYKLIAFSERSI